MQKPGDLGLPASACSSLSVMNIMGLDLSLTSTGCSVNSEVAVFTTKLRGAERLSFLSKAIVDLAVAKSIDIVIIEGYSFASRNGQAHSIGELGGAVRMRLWETGIPFIDVPPTCRAKFATGRGNASKNEVVSAISARTGIIWSGPGADDMCDAWILEQMAKHFLDESSYSWPKQNADALEKIDWAPLLVLKKIKEKGGHEKLSDKSS